MTYPPPRPPGYGYPAQPGYGYQRPPVIPAHKGWAVFTIFCGFIFGVVALIKVNEIEMALARGDFPRAWRASNTAKALCFIGNIFGVLGYLGIAIWAVTIAS
ncbi:MAG TPA: CD225/dispanin family protein [Amycolatopsis sp.]|nr:CD225/dispanin family protein [Amycolatopsis sp.]